MFKCSNVQMLMWILIVYPCTQYTRQPYSSIQTLHIYRFNNNLESFIFHTRGQGCAISVGHLPSPPPPQYNTPNAVMPQSPQGGPIVKHVPEYTFIFVCNKASLKKSLFKLISILITNYGRIRGGGELFTPPPYLFPKYPCFKRILKLKRKKWHFLKHLHPPWENNETLFSLYCQPSQNVKEFWRKNFCVQRFLNFTNRVGGIMQ